MQVTSLLRTATARAVFAAMLLIAFPNAQAQSETVLYSFCGVFESCSDGALLNGPLAVGEYGNFYGTTYYGGADDEGAVFGLYPEPAGGCETGSNTGNGWCEFVLYSFCSLANCADGQYPLGSVSYLNGHFNRPGNLYGTTSTGGAGNGTVFEIFPEPLPQGCPSGTNGGNGWCEGVLYKFCSLANCADGYGPSGNLVEDSAGDLYGTVATGVFELSPNGSGGWNEGLIYQDVNIQAGLAIDSAGIIYGVDADFNSLVGHVFKLSLSQNGWVAENIHTFSGSSDGVNPNGPPAIDSAGNVYGTTESGGKKNFGMVWKLIPVTKGSDAGTYKEKILHWFNAAKTGVNPGGGVTLDPAGNIYGTTTYGGGTECGSNGCGTLYEMTASDGNYKYKFLWSFDQTSGEYPYSAPLFESSGNLFGVTYAGGVNDRGAVYELTP
jgi:hypothetical protein